MCEILKSLPAVIGRMAFFDGDEGAAAGRADLAVRGQFRLMEDFNTQMDTIC